MHNEYIHNWEMSEKYLIDDQSDYYMEEDDDKWVIMPTEELFDDGSDDDEPNSEKKGNDNEVPFMPWFRKYRPRPNIHFGQTGSAGGGSGIGAGKIRPTIRLGGSSGRSGVRQEPSELHKSANQPLRDPKGGLTAAGRRHFKETEGANLKPGVTGPADTPTKMRRKGSFLVRFFTNPRGPMVDEKGRPTRLALSAHAWGEPVPKNLEDAAKLAAKGRRLLDRYRAQQEQAKGKKSFEQFQLSLKQSDAWTGSPGGTNRGRVGETGTRTASGRITQRVYSGGRRNSRSLMSGGPNSSSYSRDKYFLVDESGKHPHAGKASNEDMYWDEDGKSFDMPGRSHGGVAPRVPKGAWTGSPGGTTHGLGDYRHLPRTASGRKQKTFVRGQDREEAYPKDKYFLIGNDGQPVRRRLK